VPLSPPGPPRQTNLHFDDEYPLLFFSPDSRKLLVVVGDEARLLRFPSLEQEASVLLPVEKRNQTWLGGRFLPDGSVLLLFRESSTGQEGNRIRISRWRPEARRLEETAVLEGVFPFPVRVSLEGDRILCRICEGNEFRLRLADCRTGRILQPSLEGRTAVFLADGRFLTVAPPRGGRRRVILYGVDGTEESSLLLPPETRAIPIGEISPGKVALSVRDEKQNFREGPVALFDVRKNGLEVLSGMKPGWVWLFAIEEQMAPPPPERAAWRRLFRDAAGRWVLYEPETGRFRPLAGG
jgi:hypothetical protein